jgi:hypothetical protein
MNVSVFSDVAQRAGLIWLLLPATILCRTNNMFAIPWQELALGVLPFKLPCSAF